MPEATRRGRPAGLLLNPVAARHFLKDRPQSWLAADAGISNGQLSAMLSGSKGAGRDVADSIAASLGVEVEVLFPELVQFTTTIRHFTAPKIEDAAA